MIDSLVIFWNTRVQWNWNYLTVLVQDCLNR